MRKYFPWTVPGPFNWVLNNNISNIVWLWCNQKQSLVSYFEIMLMLRKIIFMFCLSEKESYMRKKKKSKTKKKKTNQKWTKQANKNSNQTYFRAILDPFFLWFLAFWALPAYCVCIGNTGLSLTKNFADYTLFLILVNLASPSEFCNLSLHCMHSKYRFGENYCIWHPFLTSQFTAPLNLSLKLLPQSLMHCGFIQTIAQLLDVEKS